jgi:hypothetical protein
MHVFTFGGLWGLGVTPQVLVHLNTDHCTPFKLKRKMWKINSKRRGQIKVKVYKRNYRRKKKE